MFSDSDLTLYVPGFWKPSSSKFLVPGRSDKEFRWSEDNGNSERTRLTTSQRANAAVEEYWKSTLASKGTDSNTTGKHEDPASLPPGVTMRTIAYPGGEKDVAERVRKLSYHDSVQLGVTNKLYTPDWPHTPMDIEEKESFRTRGIPGYTGKQPPPEAVRPPTMPTDDTAHTYAINAYDERRPWTRGLPGYTGHQPSNCNYAQQTQNCTSGSDNACQKDQQQAQPYVKDYACNENNVDDAHNVAHVPTIKFGRSWESEISPCNSECGGHSNNGSYPLCNNGSHAMTPIVGIYPQGPARHQEHQQPPGQPYSNCSGSPRLHRAGNEGRTQYFDNGLQQPAPTSPGPVCYGSLQADGMWLEQKVMQYPGQPEHSHLQYSVGKSDSLPEQTAWYDNGDFPLKHERKNEGEFEYKNPHANSQPTHACWRPHTASSNYAPLSNGVQHKDCPVSTIQQIHNTSAPGTPKQRSAHMATCNSVSPAAGAFSPQTPPAAKSIVLGQYANGVHQDYHSTTQHDGGRRPGSEHSISGSNQQVTQENGMSPVAVTRRAGSAGRQPQGFASHNNQRPPLTGSGAIHMRLQELPTSQHRRGYGGMWRTEYGQEFSKSALLWSQERPA